MRNNATNFISENYKYILILKIMNVSDAHMFVEKKIYHNKITNQKYVHTQL